MRSLFQMSVNVKIIQLLLRRKATNILNTICNYVCIFFISYKEESKKKMYLRNIKFYNIRRR